MPTTHRRSLQRLTAMLAAGVAAAFALAAPASAVPVTFASSAGIAIPSEGDAAPYPSTISVSGQPGPLSHLRVTLDDFSHSYTDDVSVVLRGPNGNAVRLMSDIGGSSGVTNLDLVLDDAAASSLPDDGPLVAGTFKPTTGTTGGFAGNPAPGVLPSGPFVPYGSSLDTAFGGTSPNGTWSLYVYDDSLGDGGSIGGWSLTWTAPGDAPGTPDMEVNDDSGASDADDITNDSTPHFAGDELGAPRNLQVLADPGTPADPADDIPFHTLANSLRYFTDDPPALPDGAYDVYAKNLDTGSYSASVHVVIDTVGPTTSTPDLAAASDTGPSQTDDVTTDTTPELTGTSSENAATTLLVDGVFNTGEADPGTATYDLIAGAPLAPGSYEISALSKDVAGNLGPHSGTLHVEIAPAGCDQGPARIGTDHADWIFGTSGPDHLVLLGGDDNASALGGDDCVEGGTGDDHLDGGPGKDVIYGDDGADTITGGAGADTIYGGPGDDHTLADDGRADTIDCGTGRDRVDADREDRLVSCESANDD
jgi:subtilisin-like proprotein convertase family protein